MAAGGGGGVGVAAAAANSSRSLQNTPTWALATVCFVFIALSLFIEHLIHLLSNWLRKRRKTALFEAVEKLKSVLILLGFMSLSLAVTQRPISKICIPLNVGYTMLPCHRSAVPTKTTKAISHNQIWTDKFPTYFSSEDEFDHLSWQRGRNLAAQQNSGSDYCESKGMTSLISEAGINELNIFLFVLAVMQIVYSILTVYLGRAKMRRWKVWEKETQTVEYQAANDPNRFRFTRQTTFGRRHMTMFTSSTILLWTKCFYRQFFNSVAKVDYLTLRHGFISAHLSANNSFNFQKYIQRSLEDDFKVVVGISPFMWFLVVIFMLVDVHGWQVYLWVSFLPLIIVLVLGTKMEMIVAKMALEINGHSSVIKGTPLVQPNDNHFWFSDPKYVLTLLHLTLFMNAFEIAFFIWVTAQFGIKSCYHEHIEIIIIRVVLAVTVQVICSYITLPLYALVTQMGSHFKSAVLHEETTNAIKKWHAGVRKKKTKQEESSESLHERSLSTAMGSISSHSTSTLDLSSHQRLQTLAEITDSSNDDEITEDSQQIVQEPPLAADEVHIQMPNRE